MKKINSILSLIFLFSLSGMAQSSGSDSSGTETYSLQVNIQGFDSNEGQVYIGVYDSESNWLGKNIKGSKEKINNKLCVTTIEGLAPGDYAVSIYHDKNMNDKFDTWIFGIPKEPYACSRGAKGKFGPPKWKDAVFTINSDHSIIINL